MLHDDTNRTMPEIQNIVYLFVWGLAVLAIPLEVIFHYAFGNRYLRLAAVATVILTVIPACTICKSDYSTNPFFAAIVVSLFTAIRINLADRTPLPIHPFYSGYPWLCLLPSKLNEHEIKAGIEPAFAVMFSVPLLWWDWRVSVCLCISAVALFLKNMISPDAGQYRPERAHQRPENRRLVEQFRNRN